MRLTQLRVVDKFLIFSTSTRRVQTERMALESMRIVTGCKTPEQFVAAFYRFCDAKTCFIPGVDLRPVGTALALSLRLADGTPMLRGTCVVKAAWATKDNPFERPGVQLEIVKLGAESAALFEYLLSQKTVVERAAKVIRIPTKPPPIPDAAKRSAATADDDNPTQPVVTRRPGSPIVLPANPLSDLDDGALDAMLGCTLVEEADDLAIPVDEPAPLPQPPAHDPIAILLGMAPLKKSTAPMPVALRTDAIPQAVAGTGTQPLAFASRPPATRSMFNLHAMTGEERFWFLCTIGAAVLVAAIVLASAFVFAS